MAKKQPDYAKAAKESSKLLARMQLARGLGVSGSCYGSGDRAVAIERLRRWVALAEEHLSALDIDRTASQIMLRLTAVSGGEDLKWALRWTAELEQDKREHGQLKVN